MDFEPTRAAARERLRTFLPAAGDHYAHWRNHDFGPADRANVSGLSPWITCRRLTEAEVLAAVLERHGRAAAERFVQEVFWRTWSKGWLERHASAWTQWRAALAEAQARLADDPALARAWHEAVGGHTGIDCFDAWARELTAHGYLHNHARLWFASIWIFTLRLPWALGAAFFLRHLLDGDAASNTLGWRWVAGLQTPGKTYRASADNIRRFTNARFDPGDRLATEARPPRIGERPPADPAPAGDAPPPRDAATGLLLTPDDLGCETLDLAGVRHAALFDPFRDHDDTTLAPKVRAFRRALIGDAARALEAAGIEAVVFADGDGLAGWYRQRRLRRLRLPRIPVGPVRERFAPIRARLRDDHIGVHEVLRDWDGHAWPHAGRGFFALRKHIPTLLDANGLPA